MDLIETDERRKHGDSLILSLVSLALLAWKARLSENREGTTSGSVILRGYHSNYYRYIPDTYYHSNYYRYILDIYYRYILRIFRTCYTHVLSSHPRHIKHRQSLRDLSIILSSPWRLPSSALLPLVNPIHIPPLKQNRSLVSNGSNHQTPTCHEHVYRAWTASSFPPNPPPSSPRKQSLNSKSPPTSLSRIMTSKVKPRGIVMIAVRPIHAKVL